MHQNSRTTGGTIAIVGGRVLTLTPDWDGTAETGTVLVVDGRIVAVGADVEVPAGVETLDARGGWVLPGFVEPHTHLGVHAEGEGWGGADVNEKGDPRGARLRALDAIDPSDVGFADALAAGVTTAVVMPGSAHVVGGQTCAVKTVGRTVDDMLLRAPVGVKSALGANPKRVSGPGPTTRMGVAAALRDAFAGARRYAARRARAGGDAEEPTDTERDQEVLARVLAGELLWQQHVHRADDIVTALRIAEEFGYPVVLNHVTEGHLIADLLTGRDVVAGPLLTSRSKPELRNRSLSMPGVLAAAGARVSLTTDHPVVPVQYLAVSAALAVREGLDRDEALRAMTVNPARALRLDDRVGSLAPGLDGDVVVWSGDPLDIQSRPRHVVVDGRLVHSS